MQVCCTVGYVTGIIALPLELIIFSGLVYQSAVRQLGLFNKIEWESGVGIAQWN